MYILDGDDSALIGRRAVKVDVSAKGGSGTLLPEGAVLLAARLRDAAAPGAQSPRPSVLLLPRIDDRIVIRVLPGGGQGTFVEGTTLNVTVRTNRTADDDEDVVVVRDVPVTGPFRDVLAMEVRDDRHLLVSALALGGDRPLPPLADAARAAARRLLEVEHTPEAKDVLVAIDMSASMRGVLADGSVEAVLDLVAGVAQVIGFERSLQACLLTERPDLLDPPQPAALAAQTRAAIDRTGFGCGFRAAPADLPTGQETVTFVVTDAAPADQHAVRIARERGADLRLVVIDDREPAGGWPGLAVTVVGRPARSRLADTPGLLSRVVGSLVGHRSGAS